MIVSKLMRQFIVFSMPILLFLPCTPLKGADISFSLSVTQGFDFDENLELPIGFITNLSIGSVSLTPDIVVTDPQFPDDDDLNVVCVMSSIDWLGGYSDPIEFSCQVSSANKTILATMLQKELSDTRVSFSFNVYDWDQAESKYFRALHTNDVHLCGLIQKQGEELSITVDFEQSPEVLNPVNFAFSLIVMPIDLNQTIHAAVSVTDTFLKTWGINASGVSNGEGCWCQNVDLGDVIQTLQVLAGTDEEIDLINDCNADGKIGLEEAVIILDNLTELW